MSPAQTVEQHEQAQKERFLKAVRATGTLTAGCKAARVSPHTVYQWREHDDQFVLLENQARGELADQLEREAIRRAWHGTLKPVFHQGGMVGHVREYSDTLLIFMLKAARPEKYRERHDVTSAGQPIQTAHESIDAAIDRRLADLAARSQGADVVAADRAPQPTDA